MHNRDTFSQPQRENAVFKKETGKLYLFNRDNIKVFPAGRAQCWIKSSTSKGWRGCRPVDLVNPFDVRPVAWWDEQNRHPRPLRSHRLRRAVAFHAWLHTFSREISDRVLRLHGSILWGGLNVLSRVPRAMEIFDSNPLWATLCYYGPSLMHRGFQRQSFAWTRRALSRPRHELMLYLRIPEAEARTAVRVLRKVDPSQMTPSLFYSFLCVMHRKSKLRSYFQHASSIDPRLFLLGEIAIGQDRDGSLRIAPRFLESLRDENDIKLGRMLLVDAVRMERALCADQSPTFFSLNGLREYHDRLAAKITSQTYQELADLTLPPSPLPETTLETSIGWVRPVHLSRGAAILDHGELQKNCIASYITSAERKECLLYAVHSNFAPVHTLEVRALNGKWRACECRGPGNQVAIPEIVAAVQAWLGELNESSAYCPPEGEYNGTDPVCIPF